MKKYLLLLVSLILFISSGAQVKKRYNRSFFGLNLGATYQQSDVRDVAHVGWGFTFGKYYHQNETNVFDFGWRFRYLRGITDGIDNIRNTNIKNNPVLNHLTSNPELNYADSLGYVYNNYRMDFNEGAFELMIGLNRLREKTRVVAYCFGGAGISAWQTKINQLNEAGKMYDYDSLGTSPSLTALETFQDASYETNAEGNDKLKIHFVPSIGLGLGWQTKRGHYVGLEHRLTWTLTDYADGIEQKGGGFMSGNRDVYHYTGFFVRWMVGGGGKSTAHHTTDPTGYSNPPPPPTYTGTPTTTTVVNPPPPPPPPANNKPAVIINYPQMNPFTTNNTQITVTASVLNVASRNDISVKVNGFLTQNFAYDMMTKALTITSALSPGNNAFYISAGNPYGSDWKNVNIIYEQGMVNPPPMQKPVVTITSPAQNPFSINQNNITVIGTVVNVSSKSDITAYVNGIPNGTFKYDVNSKVISLTLNLNMGSNTVKFNATNQAGSDSKTQTIIYQTTAPPPPPPTPKPIVTITSPSPNPYYTNASSQIVYAVVQNVNSSNDINVLVNGSKTTNFSYDMNSKNLVVSSTLNAGNNIFSITATNPAGNDSKSITVVYANKQAEQKPQVIITSPPSNPFNTSSGSVTVKATVMYVASQQEISVKVNSQPLTNFSYNTSTKVLSLTSNLNEGNNLFSITASNQNGTDSKSLTVNFTKKVIIPKPIVTINSPSSNPFSTSQNNVSVIATVLNVNAKNEITVKVNTTPFTNFNYSADSKNVTFHTVLNNVSNTIAITASNNGGSDSKSIVVNYKPPVELPKPAVTITYPASNPFTTNNLNITITATVHNVASKNDISITTTGNAQITNFNYDANTKILSFSPALQPTTPITIKATNPQGSDSKSVTINYVKPEVIGDINHVKPIGGATIKSKPVVTITNPATNPAIITNPTVNFTATVLNVGSQNDIKVTLNGKPFTNFTYDANTKIVSFTATMPFGSNNVVTVTGTNPAGSDTKSVTLNAN